MLLAAPVAGQSFGGRAGTRGGGGGGHPGTPRGARSPPAASLPPRGRDPWRPFCGVPGGAGCEGVTGWLQERSDTPHPPQPPTKYSSPQPKCVTRPHAWWDNPQWDTVPRWDNPKGNGPQHLPVATLITLGPFLGGRGGHCSSRKPLSPQSLSISRTCPRWKGSCPCPVPWLSSHGLTMDPTPRRPPCETPAPGGGCTAVTPTRAGY